MSARNTHRVIVWASLLCVGVSTPTRAADVYVFADTRGVMHFSDRRPHKGYHRFVPSVPSVLRSRASVRRRWSRFAWDGVISIVGRTYAVSPGLLKAVIHAESGFNPRAISSKGARGLMQLMPETAQALGVDDPFNPWQNIEAGTRYLSSMIQRFGGDLSLGLAAYHAGERAVRRYNGIPPYEETRNYVKKVLSLRGRYDAHFR